MTVYLDIIMNKRSFVEQENKSIYICKHLSRIYANFGIYKTKTTQIRQQDKKMLLLELLNNRN